MIERIYVHNYRCFENFTLDLKGLGSALIIGKNGSGKSTLQYILGLFQLICKGGTRADYLFWPEAIGFRGIEVPVRFEIGLRLDGKAFHYGIALQWSEGSDDAHVSEEDLSVDGRALFSRRLSQVTLDGGTSFELDASLPALSLVNDQLGRGSVHLLRSYLASLILLSPVPRDMADSAEESHKSHLMRDASNFGSWLNAVLARYPARYEVIARHLKEMMPDFSSFDFESEQGRHRRLHVTFEQRVSGKPQPLRLEFASLSDGEKCFFLSAAILALTTNSQPVFCFWDEPDNHLALAEVGHFVTALRRMSNSNAQFIATSHHPETIRRFSDENTFVFTRNSHLEPTVVRLLSDLKYTGDLVSAIRRGEVIE